MFDLIVKLMFIAALCVLGMTVGNILRRQLERKSRQVLSIDWKAISVFPQEAKRFQ